MTLEDIMKNVNDMDDVAAVAVVDVNGNVQWRFPRMFIPAIKQFVTYGARASGAYTGLQLAKKIHNKFSNEKTNQVSAEN